MSFYYRFSLADRIFSHSVKTCQEMTVITPVLHWPPSQNRVLRVAQHQEIVFQLKRNLLLPPQHMLEYAHHSPWPRNLVAQLNKQIRAFV